MNDNLVFLDVNIPMYAAGRPHRYKHPCSQVMTAVAAGRLAVAIDTEIIQEILYRYGAMQRWDLAGAIATDVLALATVVLPVTTDDITLTVELFDRHARQGPLARDLIHAAVMQNNGLGEIISVDEHFDRIEGLTRLDPQDYISTRF